MLHRYLQLFRLFVAAHVTNRCSESLHGFTQFRPHLSGSMWWLLPLQLSTWSNCSRDMLGLESCRRLICYREEAQPSRPLSHSSLGTVSTVTQSSTFCGCLQLPEQSCTVLQPHKQAPSTIIRSCYALCSTAGCTNKIGQMSIGAVQDSTVAGIALPALVIGWLGLHHCAPSRQLPFRIDCKQYTPP